MLKTLNSQIIDFETRFPTWNWLIRSDRDNGDGYGGYFCHLTGPDFQPVILQSGVTLPQAALSDSSHRGRGPTKEIAFRKAVLSLERGLR